jgi:hypothetical protein
MAKKTETPKKALKINVTTVKDFEKDPVVVAKPVAKKPTKAPEPVEEFKSTPPLFIKKKETTKKEVVVKEEKPVTREEIEGTMRYLAPRLKDPKTKELAEKELADLHVRMRIFKQKPKW